MKMKGYARLVGIAAGRRALLFMLAAALIVAATVSGANAKAQSIDRVDLSLKAPEGDFTVGDPIPSRWRRRTLPGSRSSFRLSRAHGVL